MLVQVNIYSDIACIVSVNLEKMLSTSMNVKGNAFQEVFLATESVSLKTFFVWTTATQNKSMNVMKIAYQEVSHAMVNADKEIFFACPNVTGMSHMNVMGNVS